MEQVIRWLNVVALTSLMLSVGLSVTLQDVVSALKQVRFVLLGLFMNFVAVPLVTVGLLMWFQSSPEVSAGFLILAVCPGALVAPTFAKLAQGDLPLATGMMILFAGLSAIVSPLLLETLLNWLAFDGDTTVDGLAVVKLLAVTQLIPLGLGMAIHRLSPALVAHWTRSWARLANVLLLVIVVLVIVAQFETLQAIRLRAWLGMLLLLVISFALGWLAGWGNRSAQVTLAVSTSARNAAVALMIVSANFAGTPAVTAVVAYALFSILGTLVIAHMLRRTSSHTSVETMAA